MLLYDSRMAHLDQKPKSSSEDLERFRTTHWSIVLAAGRRSTAGASDALAALCRTYWYPLYAYVRRQGHSPDDAQDLTQEYEMLTGELPLGRFAPPSRMVQIDVRLDEVVMRTLEKEPARRYQQVSDVKTDVESISREQPGAVSAKSSIDSDLDELNFGRVRSKFARSAAAFGPAWAAEFFRSSIKALGLTGALIVTGCFICALFVITSYLSSAGPVPRFAPPITVVQTPAKPLKPLIPEPSPNWLLEPTGPRLSDEFARFLLPNSPPGQAQRVNEVLQTIYKESVALEASHTERHVDDLGHVFVSIKPYPGRIAKLENRLWSELDQILDVQQQSLARSNLKLDAPKLISHKAIPLEDLVGPDFFGWGKDGARIELWRVGTWYHRRVRARGSEYATSAPELPVAYRRFWKDS
jgi:hypothetical protein